MQELYHVLIFMLYNRMDQFWLRLPIYHLHRISTRYNESLTQSPMGVWALFLSSLHNGGGKMCRCGNVLTCFSASQNSWG